MKNLIVKSTKTLTATLNTARMGTLKTLSAFSFGLGIFIINMPSALATNISAETEVVKIIATSQQSNSKDPQARKNRFNQWLENKVQPLKVAAVQRHSTTSLPAGATRAQHQQLIAKNIAIQQQALLTKSNINAPGVANSGTIYPENFNIYNAFSYLLDDIDGDGYYQSFSIVFDADFYPYYANAHNAQADVYAELYLSYNGGAWVHFHSTDIFTIYNETSEDEYEVFAQLKQGYESGTFDVLIDLYHAQTNELVSSYSSDDNNALYALPLESVDYDQPYVNEVVYVEGGSSSILWLLFASGVFILRVKRI